jgi:hypothetical protein
LIPGTRPGTAPPPRVGRKSYRRAGYGALAGPSRGGRGPPTDAGAAGHAVCRSDAGIDCSDAPLSGIETMWFSTASANATHSSCVSNFPRWRRRSRRPVASRLGGLWALNGVRFVHRLPVGSGESSAPDQRRAASYGPLL